jgi:butyrate kinase
MKKILVIYPDWNVTKIALFEGENKLLEKIITHDKTILLTYESIIDQFSYRKKQVIHSLNQLCISINELDAIAARGGVLSPMPSGTYIVNETIVDYLRTKSPIEHPANLGALIAFDLSETSNKKPPVFMTDPLSVDEFVPEARIAGVPQLERISRYNALNMKTVARYASNKLKKDYWDCNFVIAHLDKHISIGAHRKGLMIDVTYPFDEGPFGLHTTGDLPLVDLTTWIFKHMNEYSENEIKKRFIENGGLLAYLGTSELDEAVEKGITDKNAKLIVEAMAYQIAKEIGAMAAVLGGDIDAVLLTGEIINNECFVRLVKNKIAKLGIVMLYPGSYELEGLAYGALRVLYQLEEFLVWKGEKVT